MWRSLTLSISLTDLLRRTTKISASWSTNQYNIENNIDWELKTAWNSINAIVSNQKRLCCARRGKWFKWQTAEHEFISFEQILMSSNQIAMYTNQARRQSASEAERGGYARDEDKVQFSFAFALKSMRARLRITVPHTKRHELNAYNLHFIWCIYDH